jgi:predicted O-linked N-acetylglucosamine transferase (SPINDLY family)
MPSIDPDLLLQRGLEAFQAGRYTDAEASLSKLLAADPGNPNAANLLGLIWKNQRRPEEAETLFRRAIRGIPEAGGFHNNLGSALLAQGRIEAAMDAFREALRLEPGHADAALNLARVLRARGDLLAALPYLDQGLAAAPGDAELWSQKGEILARCGDGASGIACHRRALGLDAGASTSWAALGSTLLKMGEAPGAVEALQKSLELNPSQGVTAAALLMAHQYAGGLPPAELSNLHRNWARRYCPPAEPLPWACTKDPDRRLRIGLLSPDLRSHSVGTFLKPLLQGIDPEQFEFAAYSTSCLAGDPSNDAFRPLFALWRDMAWTPSDALAKTIRDDAVDILVELAGHTDGGRLDVVALRPAPIQVFWLGYPGTTGSESFQGRLTDSWVDPPGEEQLTSEPPLRLDHGFHCFQPPPGAPGPGSLPALSGAGVTFASFNNFVKLNPQVLRTWAALLQRLPDSRLLLKSNHTEDPFPLERIRLQFENEGVDPNRIKVLARIEDQGAHLAQYQQVDLALDPFPYNGVTTTCESLWMGVPVVTLRGDRQAGRYGASLLHQAGLEAFIAPDLDGYLTLALAWAQDLPRLAALRQGMRDRLQKSHLMDAPGFARAVEVTFRDLWREWCARPTG